MGVVAAQSQDVYMVGLVHCEDIVVNFQILRRKLSYDVIDIDSMLFSNCKCSWVWDIADLIIGGATRVDVKKILQVLLLYLVLKDCFSQRGPANVPQTDK